MAQVGRSLIESLGVYLPPKSVSTEEVVRGCARRVLLPLERLTGIRSRRMAGETEWGYDLAVRAVDDCMTRSRYGAADIDLILSCNISQQDGPDEHTFEPSRASRLRKTFGMHDALAFDITNACAGMFTGIYLADALIRSGAIRRALVVSGEYITHLTRTAQLEIKGLADPRLACLTLGDAGAAALIDRTTGDGAGFHAVELFTLGKHSPLCVARVTDQPHGGAIMVTDMLGLARVAVRSFLEHSAAMMLRLGWSAQDVDHVIPHQTSRATLETGSRAVKQAAASRNIEFKDKLFDNVAHRGNTASTSHFVAMMDGIASGAINSGDGLVFGILASGVTVGTAAYRLDDLPARIRGTKPAEAPVERPSPRSGAFTARLGRMRARVESIGVLDRDKAPTDSLGMLAAAAQACLQASSYDRRDLDLILSTGLYRTAYLTEPAVAALLAGLLKVNDAPKSVLDRKTLAFDLLNGGLGFLDACYVASSLLESRAAKRVLIAASEVESNASVAPDHLRGIEATASAIILDASPPDGPGFSAFRFGFFPEHADALRVHCSTRAHRVGERCLARLFVEQAPDIRQRLIECIVPTVEDLLQSEGLSPGAVRLVLPPQISGAFVAALAARLGMDPARFVDVAGTAGDLFTSSLPYCLDRIRRCADARSGDVGLIVNIAAGLEVGCAIYHF